jgi:hypothetical protein
MAAFYYPAVVFHQFIQPYPRHLDELQTMRTNELNIDILTANAYIWRGTPFVPNACERGPLGGVCVQMLVADLYRRAGLEIGEVPSEPHRKVPSGVTSIITLWLEYSPHFIRLPDNTPLLPGDLLGLNLGTTLQNLAIVLPGEKIVQVVNELGVVITPRLPSILPIQNASSWRPIFYNHRASAGTEINTSNGHGPHVPIPTINRRDSPVLGQYAVGRFHPP